MKIAKYQRVGSSLTKDKILKSGRKLFLHKGFSATSMSQLAEAADVNQSLISHHFGDKMGLWTAVKEDVAKEGFMQTLNATPASLREFLHEAIHLRLTIYDNCPDLYRLVSWERLEKSVDSKPLVEGMAENQLAKNWLAPIQHLVKIGKIKSDLVPELIFIWILMSTNGIIMDELNYFKQDQHQRKLYIDMIIEGLMKALQPS